VILADSVAKLTVASTESSASRPFSIDIAHALHDIPVIDKSTWFVTASTALITYSLALASSTQTPSTVPCDLEAEVWAVIAVAVVGVHRCRNNDVSYEGDCNND